MYDKNSELKVSDRVGQIALSHIKGKTPKSLGFRGFSSTIW